VPSDISTNPEIRATPYPHCIVCGGGGKVIHREQPDRLFGASGLWNLRQCANESCRLIWLDPMPVPEDIGKAYAYYYTHTSHGSRKRSEGQAGILSSLKRRCAARRYGYPPPTTGGLPDFAEKLLCLIPQVRAGADGSVRFLHAMDRGHLLDVGCGSGDWILGMQGLGWRVVGVDLDESAVKVARSRGLTVHCGMLAAQRFQTSTFDAVTLNHVIEHVPDPVQTLRECFRILKPGGTLVLFTPNATSLGHRIYQEYWRGLEPPRHLHIFSMQSLQRVLAAAGFQRIRLRPWVADSIIYESELMRTPGQTQEMVSQRRRAKLISLLFTTAEFLAMRWNPSLADCVAAVATKPVGDQPNG